MIAQLSSASSTHVIFVDTPYREGSHPTFHRYNQAYARKFASFWDIAPYQEGSSNYPNVPLWVSSLRPIVMGLGLNSTYVRCRIETISLPQAPVYLLSSFTSNYTYTRKIAQWIRQHYPQSKIVLGGSHASACGPECAETGDFDAIVAGEGEEPLEHILRRYFFGDGNLSGIEGIYYVRDGAIEFNQRRPAYADPGARPLPDYSFLDELARSQIQEGAVMATYGCPWRCVYCAEGSRRLVSKTPQRVVQEISRVREAFPKARFLRFVDSSFSARSDLPQMCEALASISIPWSCQTRANLMQPGRLELLRSGGCRVVNLGAESGDNRILKIINKGLTVEEIFASCQTAKSLGFKVITYWMIGLPGETEETAQQTIRVISDLMEHGLSDLAELCICVPYPGTALHKRYQEFKISIDKAYDYANFLENDLSCMHTESLTNIDIYRLWQEGLSSITERI